MQAQIVITPQMWTLAALLIENALAAIFSQLSTMSPEEIAAGIMFEQARKKTLMEELNSH